MKEGNKKGNILNYSSKMYLNSTKESVCTITKSKIENLYINREFFPITAPHLLVLKLSRDVRSAY